MYFPDLGVKLQGVMFLYLYSFTRSQLLQVHYTSNLPDLSGSNAALPLQLLDTVVQALIPLQLPGQLLQGPAQQVQVSGLEAKMMDTKSWTTEMHLISGVQDYKD